MARSLAGTMLDKLITRVTKLLAPLGVKESDIRSLIEKRLAERYADRP